MLSLLALVVAIVFLDINISTEPFFETFRLVGLFFCSVALIPFSAPEVNRGDYIFQKKTQLRC